jgi:hypothetical protein
MSDDMSHMMWVLLHASIIPTSGAGNNCLIDAVLKSLAISGHSAVTIDGRSFHLHVSPASAGHLHNTDELKQLIRKAIGQMVLRGGPHCEDGEPERRYEEIENGYMLGQEEVKLLGELLGINICLLVPGNCTVQRHIVPGAAMTATIWYNMFHFEALARNHLNIATITHAVERAILEIETIMSESTRKSSLVAIEWLRNMMSIATAYFEDQNTPVDWPLITGALGHYDITSANPLHGVRIAAENRDFDALRLALQAFSDGSIEELYDVCCNVMVETSTY